jgi:endonuclease/exonuclease/phosphatase (EEP) superfamily protein YafD
MDAIHGALAREHAPLVVIGDFNATDDHRGLRRLLGLGLHDAAVRRGKGLAMTWPRNRRLLPPLVRPDRVLVDRRLAVTGYRLGTGRGSDHRPLVTDLAVPAMPGQATEAAPRYG